MTGELVEAGHLGGYIAGGDEATIYPELWTWLVHDQGVKRVLDVGCGDGVALRYFRDLGCQVTGIDGVPQDDPDIIAWDYAKGAWPYDPNHWSGRTVPLGPVGAYDLVWSCEFVEHVEERYIPHFLKSFTCAPLVLMTHADPGQLGYHHVNCRPADYWVGALAAIGYSLDPVLTEQARMVAAINANPWNHFKRSGLAFRAAS
jgi:SAM-dependent methyltransferase